LGCRIHQNLLGVLIMQEKEHVLEVLEQAKKAIRDEDVIKLKELSNQTVHSSSIDQDPDNIAVAIVLYALSKIIERIRYREYKDWPRFQKTYESSIDNAIIALRKNDIEVYRDQIAKIQYIIEKLSGHLKKYIQEVFRKAQINKASRIYEHGISLEKTAKILGVTLWELNSYVGNTGIADVNLAYTLDLKQRLKNAEDIFK